MTTQIIPYQDVEKMARAIASSGLFGCKRPEEALALMLVAQSEGRHPASAAKEYHIIQGRPTLRADSMLARFQTAGGQVEWLHHEDTVVEAKFSHPQACPKGLTIRWDLARAKAAQLGGKDMWAKYPRQMLRARVISEGVRATFPAVLDGMYTPEEIEDTLPAREAGKAVDRPATPTPTADTTKTIEAPQEATSTPAAPAAGLPAEVVAEADRVYAIAVAQGKNSPKMDDWIVRVREGKTTEGATRSSTNSIKRLIGE